MIRVLNKTVNNITVSNITHINSYLFNGFQSIEQVFDKKNKKGRAVFLPPNY